MSYMVCLGGIGVFAVGWVVARFTHRPIEVWMSGLAISIGAVAGLFAGFALVLAFIGRL